MPNTLAEQGIHIGRDRLFAPAASTQPVGATSAASPSYDLGRPLAVGTTLLAAKVVTAPTRRGSVTLPTSSLMSASVTLCSSQTSFPRRIMGFDLSDSLTVDGLTRALLTWRLLKCPGAQTVSSFTVIMGTQYTCHAFRQQLAHHHIRSSMGEAGNAYDNALAERINGILKLEYGLDGCFLLISSAPVLSDKLFIPYNVERPHLALNYQKPEQLYHHYIRFSLN
ncbi:MAG: integrase core domain-containing protein [Caldilineaceae bacterium]